MNKTDARITAMMLNLAADEFGNHGCNDYELPNTLENLSFIQRMIAASDYPDDEPLISDDGKYIYTADFMIMNYCIELLIKESGE